MPGIPGSGGRVPKRSDQKHGHRTKAEQSAIQKAQAGAAITWPEPSPEWENAATAWYESLQVSGQAQFYEQSDVALAYYIAEMMSATLGGRVNAQLVTAVLSGASLLLTSEGDRRRMKLELQREAEIDEDEEAALALVRNIREDLA